MGEIAERLAGVRERALFVYDRARLSSEPLRIVCVTKFQSLAHISQVLSAGATEIGENYLQEAEHKNLFSLRDDPSIRVTIRYIGRLQSNKYNAIARVFDAVDSADLPLLRKLPLIRSRGECHAKEFLLEVNAGEESQKGGLTIAQVQDLGSLRDPLLKELSGLMVVVPLEASLQTRADMYDRVRALFNDLRHDLDPLHFHLLSMGTSDDFELALEHGSNMVRIGTAIFGPRPARPV